MPKWIAPLIAAPLAFALSGCGGFSGPNPTGTGPFDSRGNYVEAWADNPEKWNGRSVPKPTETQPETQSEAPPIVQADPQPQRTSSPTPPPPKPKPKPKPKPAPKFAYHTVRKGDTLYGLAKRYGTTVGTIQKTNGISGSVIRIGQKLKIPR
ncbi:LysM peptidoglycan-binding domain-containing protein [Haloferula helveola]